MLIVISLPNSTFLISNTRPFTRLNTESQSLCEDKLNFISEAVFQKKEVRVMIPTSLVPVPHGMDLNFANEIAVCE